MTGNKQKPDETETEKRQQNDSVKFETELRSKLSLLIESTQNICTSFSSDASKSISDYLFDFEGVCFSLNKNTNRNNLFSDIDESVEKYQNYVQMKNDLNNQKIKFQTNMDQSTPQVESYMKLISLLNDYIKLGENEDLISHYFYRKIINKNNFLTSESTVENSNEKDFFINSIERLIYKTGMITDDSSSLTSLKINSSRNSNYLLSFYEYCNTLYEYFLEKNMQSTHLNSCFSLLNSSPASLICKLLFEDSIKPQLIETLTQKLNLNLTAIILHHSCPRLKLTAQTKHRFMSSSSQPPAIQVDNDSVSIKDKSQLKVLGQKIPNTTRSASFSQLRYHFRIYPSIIYHLFIQF